MSRVEHLRDSGQGYARAWKDLIKEHGNSPDSLFCLFEGQDDPKYYGKLIDLYVFPSMESLRCNIWCKGKPNLLQLYDLVAEDPRFKSAWVAFFADRDFDELGSHPSNDFFYLTPCYSIENLYVNPGVIKKILHDEFGLSYSEEEFKNTLQLYEMLLDQFNSASLELNAWIFLQRKLSTTHSPTKMNLNDVSTDKLFDVKLSGVKQKYTLNNLSQLFPNAIVLSSSDLAEQIANFSACEAIYVFRGKYLIYFLSKFLAKLAEDSNKSKSREHFATKRKVSLQLSSNILSELAQYVDPPPCLIDFLTVLRAKRPQQLMMDIEGEHIVITD